MFGFLLAVLFLTKSVSWLLTYFSTQVYSVFIGMIIASVPSLLKFTNNNNKSYLLIGFTAVIIFVIFKIIPPFENQNSLFMLFISGFFGFFASILPGLSGSTILLIMGTYHEVIKAIIQGIVPSIIVFATGGVLGIIGSCFFITAILNKAKNLFFCIIIGFIIGSLPQIIPWQNHVWQAALLQNIYYISTLLIFIFVGIIIFILIEKPNLIKKYFLLKK